MLISKLSLDYWLKWVGDMIKISYILYLYYCFVLVWEKPNGMSSQHRCSSGYETTCVCVCVCRGAYLSRTFGILDTLGK